MSLRACWCWSTLSVLISAALVAAICEVVVAGRTHQHDVADVVAEVQYTFGDAVALESFDLAATGEAAKRMPKPKWYDGQLYLLES